jgi:hypothetical protein
LSVKTKTNNNCQSKPKQTTIVSQNQKQTTIVSQNQNKQQLSVLQKLTKIIMTICTIRHLYHRIQWPNIIGNLAQYATFETLGEKQRHGNVLGLILTLYITEFNRFILFETRKSAINNQVF